IEDCEVSNTGVRADNAEGIDSIGSVGLMIRRSYIHDTRTTGIYLKGGARDGVVERCRIARSGQAGLLLGQDTDLEYMRDGTQFEAINCVGRNNIIEGAKGAGIGTYSGHNIRFENNTVYDSARENQAGFYVAMNHRDVPSRQVTFKNNILVQFSERPMAFIVNMAGPLACDSNIYFRPGGGPYKFWQEVWPDAANYWQSFSDWQKALNVDKRSIIADPRLDSANLYRLSAGSPAIDRGEPAAGVTSDYAGAARPQGKGTDIGAHETATGPRGLL
ncbi:MAG TPA: right-handed parallel beta-helix repeat-containing protein, partial [Blastocatellia bacterium]|nr:right-handed parallel beta-helix repeat-containing protein [Blastocatellia bacterium]